MEAYVSLIPFLIIVFAAALTGALFMPGEWYKSLSKPTWTPPDWLFAPAWTVLYAMIAVAGWLVWQTEGWTVALFFWIANIIFNAAWSWLMFGRQQIQAALYDALAMLLTIIAFIALTKDSVPIAAGLFVPYLAWVAFATALNYAILIRNPRPT
ncbi:MAG: TspO/MBR family protein [Pseudomonadota bacterium]